MARSSNWFHQGGGSRILEGKFFKNGTPVASMSNKFGVQTRIVAYTSIRHGFNVQMMKLHGRTREGLEKAVDFLEYNMNHKYPMTPEKTGKLRRAWYKNIVDEPDGPKIEFGYKMDKNDEESAPYAWFVHEMTEPPYDHVNWTLKGSDAHWFQDHLQNDKEAMLYFIKIYAKKALV